MRRVLRLLVLSFMIFAAAAAAAQDAATLVADRVFINADNTLTAEGKVEVLFKGQRLTARRIVYSRASDELTIEGPITVTDGQGAVITADQATLSRDLTQGVLTSARMVLQDKMQLASNSLRRVDGRYTELDKVVASSCQVCPNHPVPLWEIRARKVVHDQERQSLTFDNAQFRVAGVPIFWLPRLRIPDPSVSRASGFLQPKIRTTSGLGFGLKLPYFIAIGESRDLTVTPYVSTGRTHTLELRYRQAFAHGTVEFDGAVTRDTLRPGHTRGYLFGNGRFDLPRGFVLTFGIQATSDRAYLLDYGISDQDRLSSGVDVTRTRRNEYIDLNVFTYNSIRTGESNATLPSPVADATYQRRFKPQLIGGEGGLRFSLHDQYRASTQTADLNGDGAADGRDVARATLALDWRRNWVSRSGIVAAVMARTTADFYSVSQDPAYPGTLTRFTPTAGVELRWPWVRQREKSSELVEPIMQVVWSPDHLRDVPNEDSQLVEFDESNLFSLDRFPGADLHERGLRANIGLSYTRINPDGWSLGLLVGRVIRQRDLSQFTAGSGLSGTPSNWLVATQLQAAGLDLTNRALFNDGFGFTRDELRLSLVRDRYSVGSSYIWQVADLAENRATNTNELAVDAKMKLTRSLTGGISSRYDFVYERTANAGLTLRYTGDCTTVDLSLSRRFTSSTSVQPVTDFGVSVSLSGIGSGPDGKSYRRMCGR